MSFNYTRIGPDPPSPPPVVAATMESYHEKIEMSPKSEDEHLPLPPPLSAQSDLHFLTSDGARRDVESHVPIFHIAEIKRRIKAAREKGSVFWRRFNGAGRRRIGNVESFKNIAMSSSLNILFLLVPVAWAAHYSDKFGDTPRFILNFLVMIPIAKMFDWGGEQLAMYCGTSLGDLIIITMNNSIEVALALILMWNCELKILQSTVVGVVMLHLLLIPGMTFLTGGSKIWEQQLSPHTTQLNQSLLIVAVMSLVLPSAYFSALDRGANPLQPGVIQGVITDKVRGEFLKMSRATAVFLLLIYIFSRFFLHNPPGEHKEGHPENPEALKQMELELERAEPETNAWICLAALVVTVHLATFSAIFLVASIEPLREQNHIRDEWFGIILLPICSFSADAAVAIIYFVRKLLGACFGTREPEPPSELAKARAIDGSIQFLLFWFPVCVLISWADGKPLTMLFDLYEIALLLAASFMVNYITQDSKTNWVEGAMMVIFYILIALWTWFYEGQPEVRAMLACHTDVADAIEAIISGVAE